jgi:predicted PurR-regulated permease PerM
MADDPRADTTRPPDRSDVPGDQPGDTHGADRPALVWLERLTSRVPVWLVAASLWVVALGTLAGAALWVLGLTSQLLAVTLPLILAIVLATLCVPPRNALVARGTPPALAAFIVVVGGIVAIVGTFALIAPSFVDQIQELGPTLQEGRDELFTWLQEGPLGLDVSNFSDLADRARSLLGGGGGDGGSGSSQLVGNVLSGVSTAGQFLAGLALMLVLLFFVVKDGDVMVDWVQGLVTDRHRPTLRALGSRAWSALAGYVRGTATIALIDAVAIGIGLAILGVPLVVPLAVLVFFGAFLPVIGGFLAGLVAVLVALADGGLTTGLWTLGVILLVQQVEGNLLQPIIMRRAVALHPVVVLVALATGAALAGIVGAFLSVPVAAVLASLGNEVRLRVQHGHMSSATVGDAPAHPFGGPEGHLPDRGESLPAQVVQDNAPGMHPLHDHDEDVTDGPDPVEDREVGPS